MVSDSVKPQEGPPGPACFTIRDLEGNHSWFVILGSKTGGQGRSRTLALSKKRTHPAARWGTGSRIALEAQVLQSREWVGRFDMRLVAMPRVVGHEPPRVLVGVGLTTVLAGDVIVRDANIRDGI